VTRLEYDPLGNLVRDTLATGDIIQYSADGEGRRVGRRLNGAWSGGWVYQNALNVVGELDDSGNVIRRYVYGIEPHVPALMLEGSATYRLITDQLGSVRAVVDDSTGSIVQRRDYDAWGVVTYASGTNTQALGYAGGLSDDATGLVRFGARDYDPVAGRWTAKDPVLFAAGSTNLMGYASDDPIGLVDPSGLAPYGLGADPSACKDAWDQFWQLVAGSGEDAAEYWAHESIGPNTAGWKRAGATGFGLLASLWTPKTAPLTTVTLAAGYGAGVLARQYATSLPEWLRGRVDIDGPTAGGRVIGVRYDDAFTIVRIDYDRYGGTGGQPRLHAHTDFLPGIHIPLQW
jgi:RHS repeat-associated protein